MASPLDALPEIPLRRDIYLAWSTSDPVARLYYVRPPRGGALWSSIRFGAVRDADLHRAGYGFAETAHDFLSILGAANGPVSQLMRLWSRFWKRWQRTRLHGGLLSERKVYEKNDEFVPVG